MEKNLKNKNLPERVSQNIKAWVALFHEWDTKKAPDFNTMSEGEIKK